MTGPADLSQDQLLAFLPRDRHGCPVVGGVALLKKLGSGGMGSVYLGLQVSSRRKVAVKILSYALLDQNPNVAKRFLIEARAAAAIDSANVVRVYDVGVEKQTHFMVMEYVEGETIGARIRKARAAGHRGLTPEDALRLAIAGTRGLAAAHVKRIVHRDVKPENFMIPAGDLDGAKLADLGLAKPEGDSKTFGTMTHTAMGTPGFMAPEQAENAKDAGPPADVFSMGATLYAMLTGDPPFSGDSLIAVLRRTASENPVPLPSQIGAGLRWVVDRCLAKRPEDRFQDGRELLEALERVQEDPAATGPRPAKFARPGPTGSRTLELAPEPAKVAPKRTALIVAGAAVALAIAAVAGVVFLKKPGPAARPDNKPTVASGNDEELKILLDRAGRLETEGRFEDAQAALSRAAAIAPDDVRIRVIRDRVAAKIAAAHSGAEKAANWTSFLAAADAVQQVAEAKDTPEAWGKELEAVERLAPWATGADQKQVVENRRTEAVGKQAWAGAKKLRSEGNLKEAVEAARKALEAGPPVPGLGDWLEAAKADLAAAESKKSRKKKFDEAAGKAIGEQDPAKALDLWKQALDSADEPGDISTATAGRDAAMARIAEADDSRKWDDVLAGIAGALDSNRLDEAEARLKPAAASHPGDARIAELQARLRSLRSDSDYAAAMDEARKAEKAGDKAKAHAAYAKAERARPGDAAAKTGLEATKETLSAWKAVESPNGVRIGIGDSGDVAMTFVKVAPRNFAMGPAKETRHVTLTKEFAIGVTEVTQEQWDAVMPEDPSKTRSPHFPVTNVDWWEAQRFIATLNERLDGWTVALPSEAQWECACRAGSTKEFSFGDDEKDLPAVGWVKENAGGAVHEVAGLKANAWGIFDMHGNVEEWCYDGEAPLDRKDAKDPVGLRVSSHRVMRGGSVTTPANENRCGFRRGLDEWYRDETAGLRLIAVKGKVWNPHLERFHVDLAPKVGMDFVRVRACEFLMGFTDPLNPGFAQHPVRLTRDYWIQTTETTQAQWEALGCTHTWANPGKDNPADSLAWDDTKEFLKRLTAKCGRPATLPTDAEWELACRADTVSEYVTGNDTNGLADVAWFQDNAKTTQPIGRKRPNLWGLYDMLGNASEWCQDWSEAATAGVLATDPTGPDKGETRSLRGGDFTMPASVLRSGFRGRLAPNSHEPRAGFRAVLR